MLGKTSVSDLSEHVFDLILELYNIDSHLLLSVLPQLEFKLKVLFLLSSKSDEILRAYFSGLKKVMQFCSRLLKGEHQHVWSYILVLKVVEYCQLLAWQRYCG